MAPLSGPEALFEHLKGGGGIVVHGPPKMDLESYIQNYSGRTRLDRLVFIGSHSATLCVEALKAAVEESKTGRDVGTYKTVQSRLKLAAPQEPEAVYDNLWVEKTTKVNKTEIDRLEAELKGYKNNLIKESIRMGNEDLGKLYQDIGDFGKAADAFSKMRHDVSATKQIINLCQHLVAISVLQRNWNAVQSNVQKILAIALPAEEEKAIQPYLMAGLGLVHMVASKYYDAALSFIEVDSFVGLSLNDTISPNDIAIYGGLCALASMDRDELQKKVLDCSKFRAYLELEPQIRRAISFFINCKYSACLAILESHRNDYLLDMYLQSHVTELYGLIRSKSIVQYFIPFSCVTFDSLEAIFGIPGTPIVDELIVMIQRGILDARLDTVNRTLVSVPINPRAALQKQVLAEARALEHELHARILRMSIINAGLECKPLKLIHGRGNANGSGLLDPDWISPGDATSSKGFPNPFESDSGYE